MSDLDDLLGEPEQPAEQPFGNPTEPHPSRVKIHQNGMVIDLDMHGLLTAMDPQGHYVGYNPETDEAHYEPSSFAILIADLAAQHLAKALKKQISDSIEKQVHEAVMAEVSGIVADALKEGTLQRTNEWGGAVGEAKPLKEIILDTATDALTKPMGDQYSRGTRQTVVQKIITDAVGTAFAKELHDEVAKAKRGALDAVQANAAKVIRETIERSMR